jgi:hypothetical protein
VSSQHSLRDVFGQLLYQPGALPVEPPMRFDLVVQLKTVHMPGLEMPKSMLKIANRVIE